MRRRAPALSAAEVDDIRRRLARGESVASIAVDYERSASSIDQIRQGYTYSTIGETAPVRPASPGDLAVLQVERSHGRARTVQITIHDPAPPLFPRRARLWAEYGGERYDFGEVTLELLT